MAKTFSGKQIVRILTKYFYFVVVSQKGSHIKLERRGADGTTDVTIVPNHSEVQTGTLQGILKLARVDKKDFLKKAST